MERNEREENLRKLLKAALESGGKPWVLVIGAGVTGLALVRLFTEAGFCAAVIDEKRLASSVLEELEGYGAIVRDGFDEGSDEMVSELGARDYALAVRSPGIGSSNKMLKFAKSLSIPLFSEVELAVAYLGRPEIAITGTNGKTTTVHLVEAMFEAAKREVLMLGNVGRPFVNAVNPQSLRLGICENRGSSVVAEISSYQLEQSPEFAAHIAVFLNLDDDHLERHGSVETYRDIKSRIFANQDSESDWSLICVDCPYADYMRFSCKGRYFPFGSLKDLSGVPNACYLDTSANRVVFRLGEIEEEYSLSNWSLIGYHNKLNLMAAVAASRLAGVSREAVQSVIDTFKSLPHRLEPVGEFFGALYVNDSKGTNVSAACVAIDAMRDYRRGARIFLLLGGQIKRGSFMSLARKIESDVSGVIIFGAYRDEIRRALGDLPSQAFVESVPTLSDATARAMELAASGDVVLFSPACASFDAYPNYVARGEHFGSLVRESAERRGSGEDGYASVAY
ncbi:MAG: UDP-N-acetylmuramoyl-L-alanine--D-glutamate ligase [Deltaproteobacteria bacterium]|nr:UDP-N-acetylmuramoyl-L-alanine--D-glutamate ligase [Deltaproteobacteria bacterium]